VTGEGRVFTFSVENHEAQKRGDLKEETALQGEKGSKKGTGEGIYCAFRESKEKKGCQSRMTRGRSP